MHLLAQDEDVANELESLLNPFLEVVFVDGLEILEYVQPAFFVEADVHVHRDDVV